MKACVLSVCDGEPVGGWSQDWESTLLPTPPSFNHETLGFSNIHTTGAPTCSCSQRPRGDPRLSHDSGPEKVSVLFKSIELKRCSHGLYLKEHWVMFQLYHLNHSGLGGCDASRVTQL